MNNTKRKLHLSFQIALITLIASLAGLLGIFRISYNQKKIEESYEHIMAEDYQKIAWMYEISRNVQLHESLLYAYLLEEEPAPKEELKAFSEVVEQDLRNALFDLGDALDGSGYEPLYHDIYSNLIGYFKNVSLIREFADNNETGTAAYYMKTSLQDYIMEVNETIENLHILIANDIAESHEVIDHRMYVSNTEAVTLMVIVSIAAVSAVILCTRISGYMAGTDLLTGVLNFDHLLEYGARLQKKGRLKQYAGVAVSIRNFKFINQEYGSNAGDSVLRQYAEKLSGLLHKGERIARNGADNFLLLLHTEHLNEFLVAIPRVEIEIPIGNETENMVLLSRCGVYQAEENDEISHVIDACTLALNDARKQKNIDQMWYKNAMYHELQQQKKVLEDYQMGMVRKEFQVYYQPKVDMEEGKLWGAEALVRWIRDGKTVQPYEFIPVLEAEGRITALDFYVFDRMCSDIRSWIDKGLTPVRVSSNFSKLHLKDEDFADKILHIVRRYGIDGKYIEVELTESSAYEDFGALQGFVERMKEQGIGTSIDDFGTGYSSLSMLKDLDADIVKLDRSFLFGLESGNVMIEKMIANIVRMIRDLGRAVICEGVETKQHVKFLTMVGCSYAQGFFFDKPMPVEAFEERLKNPVYEMEEKE